MVSFTCGHLCCCFLFEVMSFLGWAFCVGPRVCLLFFPSIFVWSEWENWGFGHAFWLGWRPGHFFITSIGSSFWGCPCWTLAHHSWSGDGSLSTSVLVGGECPNQGSFLVVVVLAGYLVSFVAGWGLFRCGGIGLFRSCCCLLLLLGAVGRSSQVWVRPPWFGVVLAVSYKFLRRSVLGRLLVTSKFRFSFVCRNFLS